MSDTRGKGKGLRELANEYYRGELSYESYRSERTQLLDRITHQAGDDETDEPDTQRMLHKPKVMSAANLQQQTLLRWYRRVWILITVLITTVVLIWAMR